MVPTGRGTFRMRSSPGIAGPWIGSRVVLSRQRDQALSQSIQDGLSPVVHLELGENVGNVILHRFFADNQPSRNLLVAKPGAGRGYRARYPRTL